MDQFEEARLRNAKRLERVARTQANARMPLQDQMEPQEKKAVEPQEEITAAMVEVRVKLPSGESFFTFVKPGVIPTITGRDIKRALEDGLRPLLGGVREL